MLSARVYLRLQQSCPNQATDADTCCGSSVSQAGLPQAAGESGGCSGKLVCMRHTSSIVAARGSSRSFQAAADLHALVQPGTTPPVASNKAGASPEWHSMPLLTYETGNMHLLNTCCCEVCHQPAWDTWCQSSLSAGANADSHFTAGVLHSAADCWSSSPVAVQRARPTDVLPAVQPLAMIAAAGLSVCKAAARATPLGAAHPGAPCIPGLNHGRDPQLAAGALGAACSLEPARWSASERAELRISGFRVCGPGGRGAKHGCHCGAQAAARWSASERAGLTHIGLWATRSARTPACSSPMRTARLTAAPPSWSWGHRVLHVVPPASYAVPCVWHARPPVSHAVPPLPARRQPASPQTPSP